MKWKSSFNKNKTFFPPDILQFCCDKILPLQHEKNFVRGFTEHNRVDNVSGTNYLFRSHPSYRTNSGQSLGIWMDWATVLYANGEGDNFQQFQYPCQIRCFVSIGILDPNLKEHMVDGQPIQEGPHFIGQCFQEEPCNITCPVTKLIQRGTLEKQLRLCHVDSIVSNVAVVPEFDYDDGLHPTEDYLVIQNRIQWLDYFYQLNRTNGAKSYPQLFAAYSCSAEDEAFNKDQSSSDEDTEMESSQENECSDDKEEDSSDDDKEDSSDDNFEDSSSDDNDDEATDSSDDTDDDDSSDENEAQEENASKSDENVDYT